MKTKNKLLVPIVGLLTTFLIPHYATAAALSTSINVNGALLSFASPSKQSGTASKSDGTGTANVGAKFKYTNVITVGGVQVDAIVEVKSATNASVSVFDDAAPNSGAAYSFASTNDVTAAKVFAPQVATTAANGHVDFLISFQKTDGTPVALLNVYNNSIDIDGPELVEYGGFQSYGLCSSSCRTTTSASPTVSKTSLTAVKGDTLSTTVGGVTTSVQQMRFSNTSDDYSGLMLNDVGRVQTAFNSITSLRISMGAKSSTAARQYGSIFMKKTAASTTGTFTETTPPTVDLLTTPDTTPSITGKIGGTVSSGSPYGSAIGSETFTVVVNGQTYSKGNANLTISGVDWTLTIPSANILGLGTYEVVATRNNLLVDQTNNELVIIQSCSAGTVWDTATSTCIAPPVSNISICHSGNNVDFTALSILSTDTSHAAHGYDITMPASGVCPSNAPTCGTGEELLPGASVCTPIPTHTPTISTIDSKGIPARTEDTTPTIVGTVGSDGTTLGSDAFTVTFKLRSGTAGAYTYAAVTGGTYTKGDGHLTTASGSTAWTLVPSTALVAGVYEVEVSRAGTLDATHDEIVLGLAICQNNVDKYILRSEWESGADREGTSYYLGKCNATPTLPSTPLSLTSETVPVPTTSATCTEAEGSGVRGTADISAATIKLASIMNATTTDGTVASVTGTTYQYGKKVSESGLMNISTATIDPVDEGVATGVTLTGVTLNDVYLDPTSGTISVMGGTLEDSNYVSTIGFVDPTDTSTGATSTVTGGVITDGTDANGGLIRGHIFSGKYASDITLDNTATTAAKRIRGTLSNATITGVKTTTTKASGATQTFATEGTITAGTFTISTAFGTVSAATITNGTITSANYCFTSGTIGSRGSLNWKEKTQ